MVSDVWVFIFLGNEIITVSRLWLAIRGSIGGSYVDRVYLLCELVLVKILNFQASPFALWRGTPTTQNVPFPIPLNSLPYSVY